MDFDDPGLIQPDDFLTSDPFPTTRSVGFERWSDESALIAFAAALKPSKRAHKTITRLALLRGPLLATAGFEVRGS